MAVAGCVRGQLVVIGIMWLNHHTVFSHLEQVDRDRLPQCLRLPGLPRRSGRLLRLRPIVSGQPSAGVTLTGARFTPSKRGCNLVETMAD
jgi:hypothetical protein